MNRKSIIFVIVAIAALALTSTAFAHGGRDHDRRGDKPSWHDRDHKRDDHDSKSDDHHDGDSNTPPAQPQACNVFVTKKLAPVNDPGKFNLLVDGNIVATAIGNDGSGCAHVETGKNHVVSEEAAPGTDLSTYNPYVECVITVTVPEVVDPAGTSLSFFLPANGRADCTITNTKRENPAPVIVTNTITEVKEVQVPVAVPSPPQIFTQTVFGNPVCTSGKEVQRGDGMVVCEKERIIRTSSASIQKVPVIKYKTRTKRVVVYRDRPVKKQASACYKLTVSEKTIPAGEDSKVTFQLVRTNGKVVRYAHITVNGAGIKQKLNLNENGLVTVVLKPKFAGIIKADAIGLTGCGTGLRMSAHATVQPTPTG